MKIWIDAQLSPAIAAWINRNYKNIEAQSVRGVGLRDALDPEIFKEARNHDVVIMSKDEDFVELVQRHGPPPQILWVTCGNTSNLRLKQIFSKTLHKAATLIDQGEAIVEISDK